MSQIPSAENSVDEIVSVMNAIAQANAPLSARLGVVLSVSPLKIACDNLVLDENDIWIDGFLLSGYARSTSGTTSLDVSGTSTIQINSGDLVLNNVEGVLEVITEGEDDDG